MQLFGVVDEEARLLFIGFEEVFGGDFQRFIHAFADGDAGHDDDEFAPAVDLVQLKNGLDVAVGFAGAGLHFDVEIDAADLGADEFFGQRQVLPALHGVDIGEQCGIVKRELCIAKGSIHPGQLALCCAGIEAIAHFVGVVLAVETIHHRAHGGSLIGLGFEFELHDTKIRLTRQAACSVSALHHP